MHVSYAPALCGWYMEHRKKAFIVETNVTNVSKEESNAF